MKKYYIDPSEYLYDSWKLAAMIRQSLWKPDFIVGLWRGGAPVAIAIHDFFKAIGWNVQHMPIKCESYVGIGKNSDKVTFMHDEVVFNSFHKNDKILIVDDVFDTGKTALAIKEKIDFIGAEMRFSCIYWKSQKNTTSLKPDYFVKDANNDWLVFPHEIDGLSQAEILEKNPKLFELIEKSISV